MKIKINRKQLGITLILLGLMAVLFSSQKIFEDKFKEAALLNTDMSVMKPINGVEGKINYKLPENWEVKEKKYPDDSIIYYNEYRSKDSHINGFMSMIKADGDIKKLIENDKKLSESIYNIKDYASYAINLNKKDIYRVQYEFNSKASEQYMAQEYYIKYDDVFVKFAFYVVKDKYKENMVVAFNTIVESFNRQP